MSLKEAINREVALKEGVSSIDDDPLYVGTGEVQQISATLDFNRRKPGRWNILVCTAATKTTECDKIENVVGNGTVSIVDIVTPTTPTPTPQEDQPIIDPLSQEQCVFQVGEEITITADNIQPDQAYHWWWTEGGGEGTVIPSPVSSRSAFTIPREQTNERKTTEKNPDGYLVCLDLKEKGKERTGENCIRLFFKAYQPKGQMITSCSQNNAGDSAYDPTSPLSPCSQWALLDGATISPKDPKYNDPDFKERKCIAVNTAIGDISTDPQGFVRSIFSIVLGLAGGIALILIILSGYKMMASQGNPEALQASREQLISAIIGLLFIIFSFVILQVIGVDILRIPGFAK